MDLRIAGFGGRPVHGGAGIKPMLVHDPASDRLAVIPSGIAPDDPQVSWLPSQEFAGFEAQGLATRIRSERYIDAVALYAHVNFVAPPLLPGHVPQRQLECDGMRLEAAFECYVAFLPLAEAILRLDEWSEQLLTAAESHLAIADVPRPVRGLAALGEAMRSRYASAGRNTASAKRSRRRAFELAWAGLLLQGSEPDALQTDAALEFTDAEIREIISAAERRSDESPPTPPRSRHWRDSGSRVKPRWLEDAV